jgi:hypothetical protein
VAKIRRVFNPPKEIFILFPFPYPKSLQRTLPFLAAAKVITIFNYPRNIRKK